MKLLGVKFKSQGQFTSVYRHNFRSAGKIKTNLQERLVFINWNPVSLARARFR